jgi:hypothetical protein
MDQPPGGFAQTYGVELLFEALPSLSLTELLEAVRRHCPAAEPLDRSGEGTVLAFVHPDHPVGLKDATIPAQTCVFPTDRPFQLTKALEGDLQQSWSFPEASEVVGRCRHTVLVTDLMSSPLDYRERLGLFQDALAGVLEAVPVLAIHWRPTGQFIDPRRYLEAYREGGANRFFAGSLNVRFYNISNSPGDMVMDTLGLAALGLPDLQCHFRGLEPGRVAALLSNTGYYLYEQGDVIENGHTIEGLESGSRWRCQHEDSLLPPARVVLDLDPGPPHAAGRRGMGV